MLVHFYFVFLKRKPNAFYFLFCPKRLLHLWHIHAIAFIARFFSSGICVVPAADGGGRMEHTSHND